MASLKELLALAKSQAGYQEKASNACLDDFHENAGYRNYTKYSRDVDNWGLEGCQGQPWCATYQFWLEAKTFGVDAALGHFHMDKEHYQAYNCACIYRAFQSAGGVSGSPQAGALVILKMTQILAVPVEAILGTRGWQKDKQEVQVACPCCKNKRLLDADPETVEGIIKIKCPVCKSVIAVSFHKKKVHAERIEV